MDTKSITSSIPPYLSSEDTIASTCSRKLVEVGTLVTFALGLIALATGVFFNASPCDINLSQWNYVSSGILIVLCAWCHIGSVYTPNAIKSLEKLLKFDFNLKQELDMGYLQLFVWCNYLLLMALLFFWSITGLVSVTYGTCQFSAPILYKTSIIEMIVYLLYIVAALVVLYLGGAGITKICENCCEFYCAAKNKLPFDPEEYYQKAKNFTVDSYVSTYSYLSNAINSMGREGSNGETESLVSNRSQK